jgi:HK97 family phage prohead protease/HK97 family phage major capsid protein
MKPVQKYDVSPEEDEDEDDFMDRCQEEVQDDNEDLSDEDAQDICTELWEERGGTCPMTKNQIKHKTHAAPVQGMEFVLSDETPDRMDDIIMSDGWDLKAFSGNPIALFNHNSNFPIGKWKNLRVENKQLRGYLELAPEGTSERIDEIRRLIDADILRAVSVGFRPLASQPRKESDWGSFFTKCELVETSLVSVPANPNALAVAKSLNISRSTFDMVFAEQGNEGRVKKATTGGKAKTSPVKGRPVMSDIGQRIVASEQRLAALREELATHFNSIDDSNVSDAQLEKSTELNGRIKQEERALGALRDAEENLAQTSTGSRPVIVRPSQQPHQQMTAAARSSTIMSSPRPFSMPHKKIDALDVLARSGAIQLYAHHIKKNPEEARQIIAREYRDYGDEATRELLEYSMRAASAPAMTTVVGWAAELVQTLYADFMELLMPKSVYPRLSSYGLSLSFGRAGKISIPTRSRTPTIAGSFVGEGMPIPVRQGAFTAQIMVPKKMGVITTWTREIDEHSIPAIEGLLRNAISEDTAISLDAVLLDANAATAVRPAGILNGVASIPPTAIGAPPSAFNAIVQDLKNITGALMTATQGHIRNMVFLMNPQQVLSASLIAMPGAGVFPFKDEIATGKLLSYPIIDSGTVPLGTVIALDAADFVSVGGEAPRFEISDQATLHMEDTAPTGIDGATPVRSLWQTDSLALRLILPINWTLRRPGMVAWVAGVTW